MTKLRWLTVLMGVTLIIITSFQLYWIKDNYDREKRILQIKSNTDFQETVRHLRTVQLKLENFPVDTSHRGKADKISVLVNDDLSEPGREDHSEIKSDIASIMNTVHDKIRDSLKDERVSADLILSVNSSSVVHRRDSLHNKDPKNELFVQKLDHGNKFFKFLYRVDSLQDSLKVKQISDEYSRKATEDKISVPFTVTRLDSATEDRGPEFSDITVGFAHPVTYHLELGNSFPYLINRITLPILFSIFLVGVTILSFVLLYRNLIKQQRLADLKNEFISNITHELKTPIATVGVAIEALRNFNAADDPLRTKEYLDISANELQRLSLLVDKVLKLSMFEKKAVELRKETFDLRDLLNEVLNILKLQFEKYHAKVNVETEGDNFLIEADRLHITSVFYNLLDNALKYSKHDPVIDIKLSILPHDIIELKLTDNGIGIAREYRQKIFEKFFRVPAGNQHTIKGYGLGLSYVSEIVKRHRGFIDVETELGKGTTFTIKLPRREADEVYADENQKILGERGLLNPEA